MSNVKILRATEGKFWELKVEIQPFYIVENINPYGHGTKLII